MGLFFFKMVDLSLEESEEAQTGRNGLTKMFLMLSVRKYLVPNKQSVVSTGDNTLPTLSALAPCGKKYLLRRFVSFSVKEFTTFLNMKNLLFLLK